MIRNSLAARIKLEVFRRTKYLLFQASGHRALRTLLKNSKVSDRPLVLTVAFNNPVLIAAQQGALRAKLSDDFVALIADNSSERVASAAVMKVARDYGAMYVRLPKNLYSNSRGAAKPGRGSLSHSVALDWLWNRYIRKLRPELVVLLDHDVFPTRQVSLESALADHLIVAPPREGSDAWTIWPGLAIFRFRKLPRRRITFMPNGDLDSGAGVWGSMIQYLNPESVRLMSRTAIELEKDVHEAKAGVEILDECWVHLGDGSGWFDGVGKAEELISKHSDNTKLPEDVRALIAGLEGYHRRFASQNFQ